MTVSQKIVEVSELQEEEDKKKRLGPGGLDPVEVYKELYDELKKCFNSKDAPLLQEALRKLPQQEAGNIMKKNIDCSLWVSEKFKPNN